MAAVGGYDRIALAELRRERGAQVAVRAAAPGVEEALVPVGRQAQMELDGVGLPVHPTEALVDRTNDLAVLRRRRGGGIQRRQGDLRVFDDRARQSGAV